MKKVKRHPLQRKLLAAAVAACFVGRFAYANPVGPVVVTGQATFAANGRQLAITNTPGTIINWQQFSIQSNEATRFVQQSASSAVLNRVIGIDPSKILGTLQSNGRVFLINPNGILFGAGAQIDVAGLVVSTLNLRNEDFLAGRMNFIGDATRSGAIVNQGHINAINGGGVLLIGSAVDNQGVISAPNGDVVLAAGKSVRVAEGAAPQLQVEISAPADKPLNLSDVTYASRGIYSGLVRNSGVITANSVVRGADGRIALKSSGDVTLTAGSSTTANGINGGKVTVEAGGSTTIAGGVEAKGEGGIGGTVSLKSLVDTTLESGGKVNVSGTTGGKVTMVAGGTAGVSGTIDAKGDAGAGGQVTVAGSQTGIFDGARVDASGATGGGTILVGGDAHGVALIVDGSPLANSSRTFVGRGAQLTANAIDFGSGGKVIVWSENYTGFLGAISARGGAAGGNGGFVETSSHNLLDAQGSVNTLAPLGSAGLWLLDPTDMTITTTVDANVTGASPFQPTAGGSVLTWATINAALAGSNVSVQTTTGFNAGQPGNITIANGFAYNRANSLTLNAANNIIVNGAVTNAGTGAFNLNAAGNVSLNAAVATAGGAVNMSGINISSLVGATITTTGAANVAGGAVSVNATGVVNLLGAMTANGGAGGAGLAGGNAGNVTVTGTGGVTTAAITATGGTGGAGTTAGGNAGVITITNNSGGTVTTGALTARAGAATGATLSGAAGSIAVTNNAATLLQTGAIDTSGQLGGAGGDVILTSAGGVTVTSTIGTSGGTLTAGTAVQGRNAGNVTIQGVNRTVSGLITASGGAAIVAGNAGGNAGTVLITGTDGTSGTAGTLATTGITVSNGGALGTVASGTAGSITLEATAVTATGALTTTGGANGAGGDITATATTGLLNITGTVASTGGTGNASSAGSNAGDIILSGVGVTATTITANGSAAVTAGSAQPGGAGGVIQITSTNGVGATAIGASGGAATSGGAAGGNAGSISIANSVAGNVSTTALTASTGAATGAGSGGAVGTGISVINTAAAGTLTTTAITTTGAAKGQGGNVFLSALGAVSTSNSNIITSGGAGIGSAGRDAGTVTISGGGVNFGAAGTITASGGAGNGADQAGGAGAAIQIASTNGVTASGAMTASGGNGVAGNAAGGNSGSISVSNSVAGALQTGALTARTGAAVNTGVGGAQGFITVTNSVAGQNLNTGAISAAGNTGGNGGDVTLSSQGNVTVTGTISTSGAAPGAGTASAGRNAGNVTIKGVDRSVTGLISASGGAAVVAGNAGGNAGTVLITGTGGTAASAGTLSTAGVTVSTGGSSGTVASGTAGSLTLEATAVTATGALTTTGGANGAGGDITATATSGLLNITGAVASTGGTGNASSAGSDAGDIILSGVGVTATTITANGSAAVTAGSAQPGGAGGVIQITSTNGVTATAIGASGGAATTGGAAGGNAGSITIANSGAGNVATTTLTASTGAATGTGAGGTVGTGISVINTFGNIQTGVITTAGGASGNGGNVLLNAAGTVTSVGNISIATSGGAPAAGASMQGTNAGTISITGSDVNLSLVAAGIAANGGAALGNNFAGGNAGSIMVNATGGGISFSPTRTISAVGGNAVAGVGAGGNAANVTFTATGDISTGAINMRSGNAIGANGTGGAAAALSASGANVSLGAITTTGGSDGAGGDVTVNATGTLTLTAALATSGGIGNANSAGSNAGNVTLTGAGITATTITASGSAGVTATSSQPGGAGGAILLTSSNGVNTGAITASGGAATTTNAAGGNAGSITVTNAASTLTTGSLTAGAGLATGTGTAGTAGFISVTNGAATLLTTGAVSTAGGAKANGGAVTLFSAGDVTVGGTIGTSAGAGAGTMDGASAGNIAIRGANRTVTGAITASGGSGSGATAQAGGNAGMVLVTGTGGTAATAGTLSTAAAITASTGAAILTGSSGAAGSITLEGTTVAATTLTTTGGANGVGGAINATATTGLLNITGAITSSGGAANANAAGANAGNITLSGVNVTTAGITASGTNAGAGSTLTGGAGAAVQIDSTGGMTTGAIAASGGGAVAGTAAGGNAGSIAVTNTTAGNVTLGTLTVRAGASTGTATASAGSINASNSFAGAFLQSGAIDTRGNNNSAGGSVALASQGALQFGAAATVQTTAGASLAGVAGQAGGNVSLSGVTVTTTGAITTSGGAGNGTDLAGGNAGNITVIAATGAINLSAGALTSTGGNAGALGNADGGNGGVVLLDAGIGSTITTPAITTSGGNRVGTGTAGAGGNITFADAVLLPANTTITATGGNAGLGTGGDVQFQSTVDSSVANRTLAVNTGGATTFGGVVGGTLALTSLATDATGTTAINTTAVNTTGAQTYGDAVTLGADATLASSGGGAVAFSNTVNGGQTLTVNTVGATTFAGAVGGSTALTSLTTNAGGTTAINGGAVTTSGAQTYGDNVTLGAATVFTTTNSNITGAGAVNAGSNLFTLVAGAGNVSFANSGNDFGTVTLTSANDATLRDANGIILGASAVAGTLDVTAGTTISQSGVLSAGTLTGSAGTSATFNQANTIANLGAFSSNGLTVNDTTVGLTVTGTINAGTGIASITTAGGVLALGGNNVSGSGVMLQGVGVTQGASSTVDAGAGTLLIDGGGAAVTLNATSLLTTTNATAAAVTIQNATTLALGNVTLAGGGDLNVTHSGAASQGLGSVISGGGGLTKSGTGTLTLSGANTYAGVTNINQGTVVAANSTALGSTAGGTVVANGANLTIENAAIGAEALTLNGGNALSGNVFAQLDGNVTLTTADSTITMPGGGSGTDSITLTGVISGGFGINKAGTGDLRLLGTNTYTGATTIADGTLSLIVTGSIAASSGVTVANPGTFFVDEATTIAALSGAGQTKLSGGSAILTIGDARNFSSTYSGVISGAGGLAKEGTGTLTLSGNNSYDGDTAINAGTLVAAHNRALGTGLLGGGTTVAAGANLTIAGVNIGLEQPVTLNGGNALTGTGAASLAGNVVLATADSTILVGVADALTLSGVVSGGFGIAKTGAGTLTLSGNNSYAGDTTIGAGTLKLGAANAIPNGAGKGNVSVTGTFDLNGFSTTINGLSGAGTVDNTAAATTPTLTVGNNDQTSTFSGVIQNTAGTLALTKTGTGTLTLSGVNTYGGTTTLNAGTLRLAGGNAIPDTGAVDISAASSATLDLNGTNETIGSLVGSGVIGGDQVILGAGTLTTGGNNASTAFGGVISGTGGLTKQGTGTFELDGANTYTGATSITAGTLAIGGNERISNLSAVTVAAGATFDLKSFSETIGSLAGAGTVTSGASSDTLTLGGNNTSTIFSGVIQNTGGPLSLTKEGAGVFTLSGVNTYDGTTTINAGTLRYGANNALGTTNVIVNDGGTFDLAGFSGAIGGLTVNSGVTGGSVTTGTGTLTLGGDVFSSGGAANASISGNLNLGGAIRSFNVNSGELTVSAVITGGSGLTKDGSGVLTLSGTNTYTGTTKITGGTLSLQGGNAIPDTSIVDVGAGATTTIDLNNTDETVGSIEGSGVVVGDRILLGSGILTTGGNDRSSAFAGVISGTGGLIKKGTGTFELDGPNTYTGATNITAGTLKLGNNERIADASAVTVAVGATFDLATNSETIASLAGGGTVTAGAGSNTLTIGGDNTSTTFSGVIQNTLGSLNLTKKGTGTFTLSGANTYTGTTTVDAGTLRYGANNALGATDVIVNDGTTFDLAGFSGTIGALTVNSGVTGGSVTTGVGTLTLGGDLASSGGAANASISGNLNLGATSLRIFNVSNGELSVSAAITGSVSELRKIGSGTLALSGNNTYTGTTAINQGTLRLAGGNAIPDTGEVNLVNSGSAVLDLNGTDETIGSLTGGGAIGGNVTLGTATLTTGGNNASTNYSGAISGSGGLTKQGTGSFDLNGANTYTGATNIAAGTLRLDANERISDASAVTVAAGATFSLGIFSETIGSLAGAGTVSAGATADTLTVGGNNTSTTFSGVIQDGLGPLSLTKQGTGVFTLSGNNTYHGATTINAGTLNVSSSTALGDGGATNTLIFNGGTLQAAGTITSPATRGVTMSVAGTVDTNGNAVSFGGAVNGPGALDLIGSGTVTLGGTVGNTTALASITQDAATTLNINGGLVRTTGNQTYDGAVTTGGATTLRTTGGGNVTASGVVNATAGALTLVTGTGDVSFANASNDFGTVAITSANNATLRDQNAIVLGTSTIGGALSVTSGGLISQSGALTVAGNATFDTSADTGIGSVSLLAAPTITTNTSNIGGNLVIESTAGDIVVPAGQTVTVAGTIDAQAAGTIIVNGTVNSGGTRNLRGLLDGTTITLGADTDLSSLTLPGVGGITINLTNTNPGTGTPITAQAIQLSNAGNSFGGAVSINTAMPAGGAGAQNTYNLTQSAPVTLGALQTFTLGDAGGTAGKRGNVTLGNAGNNFSVVSFTGGNLQLVDSNTLILGTTSANAGSTSAGSVFVQAGGNLLLTGNVSADAAGDAITLVAGSNFLNLTSSTLSTPSGRWLVYSTDPASDTRGGLAYDFKQYNATFGVTPVAETGTNGFLYTTAPTITPSLIGTTSKTYDGTTAATLTAGNYSFSGAIDGDVVTLNNPAAGTYIDRNVGTSKNVSASGIGIASAVDGGATVYGYQIIPTANANIGTITQRAITVSSQTGQGKTYGADDPNGAKTAYSVTSGTLVGGDTLSGNMGRVAGESVGGYSFTTGTTTVSDGFSGGNYAVTFNGTTNPFQISQAALTGTIANQTKTYGQNDPSLAGITVNLGGVINRTVVDINGNNTVINDTLNVSTTLSSLTRAAGETVSGSPYNVTAGTFNALTGSAAGNYSAPAFTGSPTLTVTPAALTGTITNQTKTYGSDDPTLSGIAVSLGGLVSGTVTDWNGATTPLNDTGNVSATLASLTRTAGELVSGSPYAITSGTLNALTGTAAGNYTSSLSTTGNTLSVTPAALTGSIANQTKVYGADDPSLAGIGVTLTGLVVNPAVSTWNGSVAIDDSALTSTVSSLTRAVGENVGVRAITAGTFSAASGNYSGPTLTGSPTLTISQAALTGSIANQTKVYGADDPSLAGIGVTLTGLVVNPAVSTWNGSVAIDDSALTSTVSSLTRAVGENVGVRAITAGTFSAASGNYSGPTLTGSPTLTISQAALTGSIANQTKVYGADDPSLAGIGVTLTGLVVNPAVSTWNGSVAIDDSALTSTVSSLTRAVGENVGVRAITAGTFSAASGNYSGPTLTGSPTLTISQAALTGSIANQTKVYGADDPSLAGIGVTLTGLVVNPAVSTWNGSVAIDDSALTSTVSSLTRAVGENVGVRAITAGTFSAASGNYSGPTLTGSPTLTISQAALTGSIANQTKVYGADDPSLAGIGVTLTGLVVNPAVSTWNGSVAIDDSALTSTVSSLTRAVGENVGVRAITAGTFSAASGNYSGPTLTGSPTLTISQAALTGSIANQTKVYGADDPSLAGIGVNLGGVVNNPAIVTWNGTVAINDTGNVSTTLASLTRAAGEVVSGSPYAITSGTLNALTGTAAGNYTSSVSTAGNTLAITPASLSGTIANQTKGYGQDDPSLAGIAVNLGGVVNNPAIVTWNGTVAINDTGNVSTTLASLTRAAGEVVSGSPYAITSGTLNALTGTAAGNYTSSVSTAGNTLAITPASLSGTIANQTKGYGQDDPSLAGIAVNLGGVVNNPAIVTWNGTVAINDTGNVSTTLASLTRAAGEVVSGSPYAITSGTLNALTGTAAGNYTSSVSTAGNTLAITPASLSGTIANQTKGYGQDDPSLAGIAVNLGGVVNNPAIVTWNGTVAINDTGNVSTTLASLTRAAGEVVSGSPYAITSGTLNALTGTAAGNYTSSVSTAGNTLAITPASLSGTIANQTKGYGQDDPSLAGIAVNLGGVVNNPAIVTWNGTVAINDTGNVSTTLASLTRAAGEVVSGSPYAITSGTLNALTGTAAGNYTSSVSTAGNTLAITPASLSGTIANQTKGYGQDDPSLAGIAVNLGGVVNNPAIVTWNGTVAINDTGNVSTTLASLTRAAGEVVSGSPYAITSGTLNALTGTAAGNYTSSVSTAGNTLAITPASLSGTIANQTKGYGQDDPSLAGIAVNLGGVVNNPAIVTWNGTVAINDTGNVSTTLASLTRAAGEVVSGSPYAITSGTLNALTGTAAGNYTSSVSTAGNTLAITPASLSGTIANQTKGYGQDDPSLAGIAVNLGGVVNNPAIVTWNGTVAINDTGNVSTTLASLTRAAGEVVSGSPYAITSGTLNALTGTAAGNYTSSVSTAGNTLAITPASLSGTIANQTKGYGQDDPSLAGIAVNLGGVVNNPAIVTWNGTVAINDTGNVSTTLASLTRAAGEVVSGSPYAITSGTLNALTGTAAGNYTSSVSTAGNTLAITPASLSGTIANQTKGYGQDDPSLAGIAVNLGGVVNNPAIVTWNGTVAINDTGNVSTTLASLTRAAGEVVSGSPYAITSGTLNALTGTAAGNYTSSVSTAGNTLAITPASLSGTIANQTKGYGQDDPSLAGIAVNLGGVVNNPAIVTWNGTVAINDTGNVSTTLASLTRAAGEVVSGSPYAITSGTLNALTGTAAGNYTSSVSTAGNTLAITPASLTGTLSSNPSKTYGASDPAPGTLPVTLAGVINNPAIVTWNGNVAVDDTASVVGTPTSLTRVAGENVGGYNYTAGTLALSGSAAANYSGAAFVPGASLLNVTPAALTITADDKSRPVSVPNPVFTASYSGFQFGETPAALTGTIVFTTPAVLASPPGAYVIIPSGQTSTNYLITYVNGILTVGQQPPQPPQPQTNAANSLVFDQMTALQRLGINDATRTMPYCGDKGGASGGAALGSTVVTVAGQCGAAPGGSVAISR